MKTKPINIHIKINTKYRCNKSNQLQYGYNIRSMTHSHPLDTNFGNNDNSFIEGIVDGQIRKGFYIPDFYIYHVPSKTYIKK